MHDRAEQQYGRYQAASRTLDRALAIEAGFISPRRKKRRKAQSGKSGRKPKYNLDAIRGAAEKIAARGSFALFCDDVSDRLVELKIREPADTRFKELLRPIYRAAKGGR
jgi:hypothetical protein